MTGPQEPEDQPAAPAPLAPMPSAPEAGAPVAVARPRSVDRAFILWTIFAVLLLATAVLFITVSTETLAEVARTAFRQRNQSFTDDQVSTAVRFIRTAGIGFNVLFAVLILGLAFAMRAGRNWARITLCVLAGVTVVGSLFGFGANILFTLVELIVGVLAAVFMFRGDAGTYFNPYRKA